MSTGKKRERAGPKKAPAAGMEIFIESWNTILENMFEPVLMTDPEGKIIEWNPAAEKLYGYRRNEMLGRSAEILNPPGEGKKVTREIMAALGERGRWRGEIVFVGKDGNEGIVEATIVALPGRDGKPAAMISCNRDITTAQKAEEELREALDKFNSIIEETPLVAVSGFDRDGTVVFWNRTAERLYGYSAEEARGRKIQDLLGEGEETGGQNVIREVWDSGRAGEPMEFELTARAGEKKWVYSAFFPIFRKGEVSAVYCMDIDISDRKRAEEELRETNRYQEGLFRSIQDGISVLDADLTVRQVNALMNRWYADNQPLEGKKCFRAYHNRDAPCDPCPSRRCLETGKTEREVVPGLPGSAAEWLEVFSYPLRDPRTGRVTGVVEFVRDITERKQSLDRLGAQLEELRRWQKATLGRETRVIELKREVNELLARAGEAPRYRNTGEDGGGAGDLKAPDGK